MEDLLRYMLENIVENEKGISVRLEDEDDIIRIYVKVEQNDYARIIGKNGQTIKSLTEIVRVFDSKHNPSNPHRIYINVES